VYGVRVCDVSVCRLGYCRQNLWGLRLSGEEQEGGGVFWGMVGGAGIYFLVFIRYSILLAHFGGFSGLKFFTDLFPKAWGDKVRKDP